MVRVHEFKKVTRGRVVIWGDEGFLDLANKAFDDLKALDGSMYERIISGRRLRFYFNKKPSEQAIQCGTFSINDGFCKLGTQGIIARVVYAYLLAHAFGDRVLPKVERKMLYDEAKSQARAWLESKGFPNEIIEIFK